MRHYNEALSIRRELGDKSGVSALLNNIGLIYEQEGNILTTFAFYTRSLRLAKNAGNKEAEAIILQNMMRAWIRAGGSRRKAILFGKQSINKYQELRGASQGLDNELQKSFLREIKNSYQSLAEVLIMEGQIEQAVQILNLYRDQQFFDLAPEANVPVRQIPLSPREQKFAKLYEIAGDRLGQIRSQIEDLEKQIGDRQPNEQELAQQKQFDTELRAALESLLSFILDVEKEFIKPLDEKDKVLDVKDVEEMQNTLRELATVTKQKTVTLYTLIGTDKFHIILITPNGAVKTFESAIKADDLNKKILQFYALLQSPAYDPTKLGKGLYDVILKPVEAELKKQNVQTLMWQLDGNLRYVPMAALFDGKRFLAERYNHVNFTRADGERLTRAVSPDWTGTGFGTSNAQTVELLGDKISFSALPGVKAELAEIFKRTDSKTGILAGEVLPDEQFTKTNFLAAMKRKRPLVHIASHFSFRPGDEARSFLLLGGGAERKFSLVSLKKKRLDKVELLTLSACNTAMTAGNNSSGVEVEGFGALAQQQGAKSVLATLWAVADDSTKDLMTEFYGELEKNPAMGKAEALRKAQIKLINGTNKPEQTAETRRSEIIRFGERADDLPKYIKDPDAPFAHPYFWSPFILFGNWK